MNDFLEKRTVPSGPWRWPIDLESYERSNCLTDTDKAILKEIILNRKPKRPWIFKKHKHILGHLLEPIQDALICTEAPHKTLHSVQTIIIYEMAQRESTFWSWNDDLWREIISNRSQASESLYAAPQWYRNHLFSVGYLLCGYNDFSPLRQFQTRHFAAILFGQNLVDEAVQQVRECLVSWGYNNVDTNKHLHRIITKLMIVNYSPFLEDLSQEIVKYTYENHTPQSDREWFVTVSKALTTLGVVNTPLSQAGKRNQPLVTKPIHGVSEEWVSWCRRWYKTATKSYAYKKSIFNRLISVGRWLVQEHPEVTVPSQWTRELAIEYRAATQKMRIGDFIDKKNVPSYKLGKPLNPRTINQKLVAIRVFLTDCQEWGWIERKFNPNRFLGTPKSVLSKIGPKPRVINADIWAKLLWAGLNLSEEDIPIVSDTENRAVSRFYYPLEMVKAVVVVWLFCGLRKNEIQRLRLGCIRWQSEDLTVSTTGEILPQKSVCLLDVPVTKTYTERTIPVDTIVGEAIDEWEKIRPKQPPLLDRKTGEFVNFLFMHRGRRLGPDYINLTIIPMLCEKAGLPREDARGRITSHRARSTIASQLFNTKKPMSLFEIQKWLGHKRPGTTQHYVGITPTKLAKSFMDADYFKRNMRTIQVLIDQTVVKNGLAASGEPWKYYDLGHGYCTYDFFDQCPHRMACAKCSFYLPKDSSKAQLLESQSNLARMMQEIPLSEEERAAVEDGMEAMKKLHKKLGDIPTPSGPTPRQLNAILLSDIQIGNEGEPSLEDC